MIRATSKDIKQGASLRLYFGEKNPNNKLIHVRAIIDDVQIVYRIWLRHKGYWKYSVESLYFLRILADNNNLFKA